MKPPIAIATLAILTLTALAVLPTAAASPTCVGKPGMVQACAGDYGDRGTCAAAGFGLQGGYACVNPRERSVTVCTSLYINHVGYCPTDLIGWG